MASAFGHAFSALAIGASFKSTLINKKFWFIGMLCAILPDIDVLGFKFGVAYGSFWGHRGFTHSIVFALFFGLFCAIVFYLKKIAINQRIFLAFYFFLCTASHSVLDAMTSGGKGVAFFSPFINDRYFFPWRPIKVSPIGIQNFISEWGLKVILSELIWIGIPCLFWILFQFWRKQVSSKK